MKPYEELTTIEEQALSLGFCPDCGGREFYEGPSGGASQNWYCANDNCGSRFNIGGGYVGPTYNNVDAILKGQKGSIVMIAERISEPHPNAKVEKRLLCDFPANWDTSQGDQADWCVHHQRYPHYEIIAELPTPWSPPHVQRAAQAALGLVVGIAGVLLAMGLALSLTFYWRQLYTLLEKL